MLSKRLEKRTVTFQIKVLRSVYGPMSEDGVERIRHNPELKDLFKNQDIVGKMKNLRFIKKRAIFSKE